MATVTGHTSAIRAKKVIGTNVKDTSGRKIGEIEDVVLDKQSNSIMFAVVGFGGLLGMAEKFHRPVIVFVDTPAAYPGIESEERGVAEAIALNLREMALLDVPIARDEAAMRVQADQMLAMGAGAVLIKGGHLAGRESVDLLVDADGCVRLAAPRIETRNTHGTGCTLASAVAAGLAKGLALGQAAEAAKAYVSTAIAAADRLKIGHGNGPVHHFHDRW